MTRKLAYLSVFVIIIFIPAMEIMRDNEGLKNSLLGKSIIAFLVLGGVIPWFYALRKAEEYKDRKLFWYCFLSTGIAASYFLFKIHNKYEKNI